MNPRSLIGAILLGAAVVAFSACEQKVAPATQTAPQTAPLAALAPDGQPPALNGATPGGPAAAPAPKLLPRFVDIGTTTCVPCRVMLGVMEELEAEYADNLKIEFVNMKNDPQTAEKLGVRTIPTQVFFSPEGKELWRHIGVIRAKDVIAKWAELGYKIEPSKKSKG